MHANYGVFGAMLTKRMTDADEVLCWAAGDKMDPLDSCMSFHKNEAFAGRRAEPEHPAHSENHPNTEKPVSSPGSSLACARPSSDTASQAAMPRQALKSESCTNRIWAFHRLESAVL